ncbi:protein-L-isoaspartate(D-aspartate) O-methyltransferase [Mesorhizobium sp. J18]|uniref:protein-L-isoaspartate(D-aspartate) O-methyltransferase n=1 Tax=Mesorhizobium sp. J18 TaxID=935263 RepID=UPI0011993BF7|nr:protein-L-isoaspartate(D-aspartate) O-methyltransferase [Mesorhizobium sp. J18]TWG95551.1 protein-L-isoaspartate(D-aspartate) O-methyltransferase [Mesorhizobium sp. J18]
MTGSDDEREGFAAFMLRMRTRGIGSKELFAAMEITPRSSFIPAQWKTVAWSDRMVPIECGEAIEGCDLQALMIDALELNAGHRVLEVGTGSGYTAAIIGRLAGRVLSLERFRTLTELARQRLEGLGMENVVIRQADGSNGAPAEGPFDRIIVWAAFESMPRNFAEQLSSGGILIAPIGPEEGVQTVAKLVKTGSRFERTDFEHVRLQPLGKGIAAAI